MSSSVKHSIKDTKLTPSFKEPFVIEHPVENYADQITSLDAGYICLATQPAMAIDRLIVHNIIIMQIKPQTVSLCIFTILHPSFQMHTRGNLRAFAPSGRRVSAQTRQQYSSKTPKASKQTDCPGRIVTKWF
ncbi:hypothetical protein QTP88_026620 [Uroleucon formosanum]